MSVSVAVVGLGFGEAFIPIYRAHPAVDVVGVVDQDSGRLHQIADRHGVEHRFTNFDEVLADGRWDAVHILVPVRFHARYAAAALAAGKHCASAVPMGTSVDEVGAVLSAQARSGKNYMMMETSVYSREYLTVEELYKAGDLGELTLYRGFHIQNLDGFPWYWQGFPPMHYVTHALSPVLALTGSRARRVAAMGAGRLTGEHRNGGYGNDFPAEIAIFELTDHHAAAQVTMSFFHTARSYTEGFDLYGDRAGVEWPTIDNGPLRGYRFGRRAPGGWGSPVEETSIPTKTFAERLPIELSRFVDTFAFEPMNGDPPEMVPAHHGGSHPHLVDEFISSITEGRSPAIDASMSSRWNLPGILAHDSAVAGGTLTEIPQLDVTAPG